MHINHLYKLVLSKNSYIYSKEITFTFHFNKVQIHSSKVWKNETEQKTLKNLIRNSLHRVYILDIIKLISLCFQICLHPFSEYFDFALYHLSF